MKLKLDENIGRRGIELLISAGHDTTTVEQQGIRGAPDENLLTVCTAEDRVLLTLDRDFGHIIRFAPARTAGIVILDVGRPASHSGLLSRLQAFVALAAQRSPRHALWIVEPGRIRIHAEDTEPQ